MQPEELVFDVTPPQHQSWYRLPIQTPPPTLGRESALSTAPGDWDCLLASGTIMQ